MKRNDQRRDQSFRDQPGLFDSDPPKDTSPPVVLAGPQRGACPTSGNQAKRAAVLRLLSDLLWHSTAEINAPDVGGSEGTRRLRELRAEGYEIVKRRSPNPNSTQYEYRYTGVEPL